MNKLETSFIHYLESIGYSQFNKAEKEIDNIQEGTTILAFKYKSGALIAGDRRLTTADLRVADDHLIKVLQVDDYSAIAISGAAGRGFKLAELFIKEVRHYEKIVGRPLSIKAKAKTLSFLVEKNMIDAKHGLIVSPILACYDTKIREGIVFNYDISGFAHMKSETRRPFATGGSGSSSAETILQKFFQDKDSKYTDKREAIKLAIDCIETASHISVATVGLNLDEGVYPIIKTISEDGVKDVTKEDLEIILQDE